MRSRHSAVAGLLTAVVAVGGCKKNTPAPAPTTTASSESMEWVNFHGEVPLTASAFDPMASQMFGAQAQAGQFLQTQQMGTDTTFYMSSAADPANPAQVILTFTYNDGSSTPRTLAQTPASYATAKAFITAVDAAIAKLQTDLAANNAQGEQFDIEYQSTSSQGGTVSFGVKSQDGVYPLSLVLTVTTPHTSLTIGDVGKAATSTAPYEDISGTVWFTMTKDDFDYFVGHAYGSEALGNQNFSNFELDPYDWLRLTVTPDISQSIVNVSFAVVGTDGTQLQLAKAPASIYAGNTFQTLVDRMMTNMNTQEAVQAGSSTPWQVPFYYDQPQGGGVVQVITSGNQGIFTVAYSVVSPQSPLTDVSFVPYKPVTITPPPASATETCQQMGYQPAEQGVFNMTFSASSVIESNLMPGQTLTGDISCSIFTESDVTVSGPIAGAVSLQDFAVPNANLLASTAPTFTSNTLQAGDYQILCAQSTNGSATSMKGDPVTLPIGGFQIACNINPVAVQFAILDPDN